MLKLIPNPVFTADVEVTVPGQKETGTISVTFKYRGRDEYREWVAGLKTVEKGKDGKEVEKHKTVAEVLPEFVTGWGLEDPFTPENITVFLNNYPMAYAEIFGAYSRLLFESRVKN